MAKPYTQVSREHFTRCIRKVEDKQTFANISKMLDAAVAEYNNSLPKGFPEITPAIARLRLNEYSITVKTVARKGKGSVDVDKSLLTACVNEVEASGPIAEGRTELFKKVAELYNKKADASITHSVVYLRVKEFEIPLKTPSLRGRRFTDEQRAAAGERLRNSRASGGVRRRKREVNEQLVEGMKFLYPERFHATIEKAARGSKMAAIKLQCVQCMGYDINAIRNCTGIGLDKDGKPNYGCSNHPFRPYQKLVQIDDASSNIDPDTENYDDTDESDEEAA